MSAFLNSVSFQLYVFWRYATAKALILVCLAFILLPLIYVGSHPDDPSLLLMDGDAVPALPVLMLHSNTMLLIIVLLWMLILGVNDVLLNGQAVQTLIARNRNRLAHYISFWVSILVITAIAGLSFSTLQLIAADSLNKAFLAVAFNTMAFFSFCLLLIVLLNVRFTRKQAILHIVIFFLIIPAILNAVPANNNSIIMAGLSYLIQGLAFLLGPLPGMTDHSLSLWLRGVPDYAKILKNFGLLLIYGGLSTWYFVRKDFD